MAAKEILYDEEARRALQRGADIVAEAVRVTLGPTGRNVLLDKQFGSPIITKDGVTVAKEIELEDNCENTGAQLLKQVASQTNDVAGDGTTTATVLAQAILNAGLKSVAAGANPMFLKRGIDKGVAAVVKALRETSVEVKTKEEMFNVASIAGNDTEIGKVVSDAMEEVGKDGVITVEESQGTETTLEMVEGMQFDKGYLSPYMITDREQMAAILDEPYILLFEKKISTLSDIIGVLEQVVQSGKPLVIVAEDIEAEALATLVVNKLRGALIAVAVKAPGFGDRRKRMMEDLAILTNGTFISEDLGVNLETASLDMLGQAKQVKITADDTTIIEGAGSTSAIRGRIEQIRNEIETTDSSYDREKLEERLAKLSGGVAVISVGAATETELKEKQHRFEDALSATRAAVAEGIVAGGGVALINAASALDKVKASGDEKTGVSILRESLSAPLRQIAENTGLEGSVVVQTVIDKNEPGWGLNARTGEYEDMIAAGVTDPLMVTRAALENAASIASMIMTTEGLVAEIEEDADEADEG